MTPLFAYAAPLEGAALADRGLDLCEVGVGKAAAAAGLTRALMAEPRALVVLFGVCGAYPGTHLARPPALSVGDLCLCAEEVLGDEGTETDAGFQDLAALGLGEVGPVPLDLARTAELARALGGLPIVRGATVSTCSGTDERSRAVARRTGAQIETMEGAAAALACRALGVPIVELRCVSNLTGERVRGSWNLGLAVERVQDAALRLGRVLGAGQGDEP